MPPLSRKFQRRCATSTAASTSLAEQRIAPTSVEEIARLEPLGAVADNERQRREARAGECLKHGAVGSDDAKCAPSFCQSASGCALLDIDLQPAGIKLEHRRFGNPRIARASDARAAAASRQSSDELPVDRRPAQEISSRLNCLFAGQRHGLDDAQAGSVGQCVADVRAIRRRIPRRGRR